VKPGPLGAQRWLPEVTTSTLVWANDADAVATLTVASAMVSGDEPVSMLKLIFLSGIVVSVIGLKLSH
jgi:quaternary ammonium compound-resistance protein SugE